MVAGLLVGCANVVAPTGGPKDLTPPKVVEAVPPNRTVNFDGKKIEITFDEYITLENANQNVLVSPPLTNKPDIKLSNKTVVIRFKESLKPNTTYTIDLGNAVKDLHEGNVFKDYHYTFSTGEVLDSLTLFGTVLDAETKKPVEEMFVSLYDSESDSLFDQPTKRAPDFITKTDKEGKFLLNGLPNRSFLVFALKDVNSNLFYDMPNEMVAFLDTLVTVTPPPTRPYPRQQLADTLLISESDTLLINISDTLLTNISDTLLANVSDTLLTNDTTLMPSLSPFSEGEISLEGDSLSLLLPPSGGATPLTLYAFTEIDTNQMVLEKKLISDGVFRFVFRHPAQRVHIEAPGLSAFQTMPAEASSPMMSEEDSLNTLPLLIKVWAPTHDTLSWYFTPNVVDSLRVRLQYDTLIDETTLLNLKYRETNAKASNASKVLKVSSNIQKGLLFPGEDLCLRFAEPVTRLHWHDSSAFVANDSTLIQSWDFQKADEHGFGYQLLTPIDDSSTYTLQITDSVFYSVTGRTNDSISLKFRRATDQDLGNIFLTVAPPEGQQVVVQLLNASDKVLQSHVIDTVQRVEFRHLFPEKYKLNAIFDDDRNGKWSTGNYHLRFLPETVIDYKDPLDLKAGWDIDLDEIWVISR